MEFKTVTCKTLILSPFEKALLEDTAILLSKLYEKDANGEIYNQIINKTIGYCDLYDFGDISKVLIALVNNDYTIEKIE